MKQIARKTQAFRDLKPGDPFTFIYPTPIMKDDGYFIGEGETISKWFATDEPGRVFRVVAVHAPATYETRYVGFCP